MSRQRIAGIEVGPSLNSLGLGSSEVHLLWEVSPGFYLNRRPISIGLQPIPRVSKRRNYSFVVKLYWISFCLAGNRSISFVFYWPNLSFVSSARGAGLKVPPSGFSENSEPNVRARSY